jgi:hypothetical protein
MNMSLYLWSAFSFSSFHSSQFIIIIQLYYFDFAA